MSVKYEVACDTCKKDLTFTTNCVGYRIALSPENIPPKRGSTVTALHIEPPLKETFHFCGWACLREFVDAITQRGSVE